MMENIKVGDVVVTLDLSDLDSCHELIEILEDRVAVLEGKIEDLENNIIEEMEERP